jgi:hypothetical protein
MKNKLSILLIAFQFPPYSNIGSLRLGKLAKFLEKDGNEVNVLCADKIFMPSTMKVEINEENIFRTKWFNINILPSLIFGGREKIIINGYQTKFSLLRWAGYLYRLFLNFPDDRVGWIPFAIKKGNEILRNKKIDIIYASSPSPVSLIIASLLSKKWKIPWVAEFRDPWADNVHYEYPKWRRKIENGLEKIIIKNSIGIVTISKQLAIMYKHLYKKPTLIASNGYPADDIIDLPSYISDRTKKLNIIYTGTVHLDIVMLDPLFQGVLLLGKRSKKINFIFYTRYINDVMKKAALYGLEGCIIHHNRVPYLDSLKIQRNSDVLLFLIPHQYGILSAKIYEYISSLRPILAIGDPNTTAGVFLKELNIGCTSCEPIEISKFLNSWLDQKNSNVGIPSLSKNNLNGLSREIQFKKIIYYLNYLKFNYSETLVDRKDGGYENRLR